ESCCLPRVHCDRHEVLGQQIESCTVVGRRETVFGTSDIKTDHAAIAMAEGQFGNLQRAITVTHRAENLTDPDAVPVAVSEVLALFEPLLHRLDSLIERQSACQ